MPTRPVSAIISTRKFLSVTPGTSILATVRLMRAQGAGTALVVERNKLVGICTERDLAFRALAEDVDAGATPVSEIMTRNPETVRPDRQFGHALHLMYEGGFRHMPVVDENNHPLGVICARDALSIENVKFSIELDNRERITEIL